MPHRVTITSEDIAEVAQTFDCNFDDECRREALQCRACRDIQSCPGGGKTTLLVAKLAILSKKWRWEDRGICVLSHTNVARQEVESRLANHPTAHQVLSYPHFIGTIQVFVDQFLALPFLRNQGIDIVAVGNDRFASRVWNLVHDYYYLRVFLNQKRRTAPAILSGLRYEGADLKLGSAGGSIPVGEDTDTYGDLLELKKKIYEEGIFRYDDMYAFAETYLGEYPNLPEVMSERFPWVFVDEMQDTDTVQEDLLNRLFPNRSIIQRLGDVNQAIFGEATSGESQTSFPLPGALNLPQSKRFCQGIATFASRLTAIEPQAIEGNPEREERPHTVFLFDEDTISEVLTAFSELLIEVYPEGTPKDWPIKAIGYRKSPPANEKTEKIPYDISDYWCHFEPSATTKSTRPSYLIGFVREARRDLECRCEWNQPYNLLIEGILGFLRRQEATNEIGLGFTKTRLIETLKAQDKTRILEFRELLLDLGTATMLDKEYWQQARSKVLDIVAPWCDSTLTPEAWEFMQWMDVNADETSGRENAVYYENPINTHRFESPNGFKVDVEITTIHAVKGETHLATLVLETYWHGHDLKELIPFILDQEDRDSFDKKIRTRKRAKRIFVGMTRPRELLCLAMKKDHLEEEQVSALINSGWTIRDLTTCDT